MNEVVTNLFRPWFLARLLSGLAAAAVCVAAVIVAMRVLRQWRLGATTEGQLALERRAELVSTLMQAGLFASAMGVVLTVLAADRTAGSIRGAMCAYGVFDSVPLGFASLVVSLVSALACALWLVVHRLDLRAPSPTLTRTKLGALLFVAPLVWVDLLLFVVFALRLDLGVVATCCSVSLDGGVAQRWGADDAFHGARATIFYVAIALALASAVSMAWLGKLPGRRPAFVAMALSLGAFVSMLPAVLFYIAPHVYETPRHLCPFCLLRADAGGLGWPLFASLFVGLVVGAGGGLVEALRAKTDGPEAVRDTLSGLGRWGAASWALCAVLAAYPVVRFAIVSGGAELFR